MISHNVINFLGGNIDIEMLSKGIYTGKPLFLSLKILPLCVPSIIIDIEVSSSFHMRKKSQKLNEALDELTHQLCIHEYNPMFAPTSKK